MNMTNNLNTFDPSFNQTVSITGDTGLTVDRAMWAKDTVYTYYYDPSYTIPNYTPYYDANSAAKAWARSARQYWIIKTKSDAGETQSNNRFYVFAECLEYMYKKLNKLKSALESEWGQVISMTEQNSFNGACPTVYGEKSFIFTCDDPNLVFNICFKFEEMVEVN